MTTDFDDELSRRLSALGSDLDHTVLGGPVAARSRSAQRTRHQLGGVALMAVAVVVIGYLGAGRPIFDSAPPQPADTPSTAVIPAGAMLTADDLTVAAEEMAGTGVPWREVSDLDGPITCAPDAGPAARQSFFVTDEDGRFTQVIEASDDPAGRFGELRAEIEACVDAGGPGWTNALNTAWDVSGLGDEAWMIDFLTQHDPVDEFTGRLVSIRLVRAGDHVTVVADSGPAQDAPANMRVERSTLAAQRLCETFGDSCVDAPATQRIYPEPVGDLPGWLTPSDIVSATGLSEITEGGDVIDPASEGWPFVGMPLDPHSSGATTMEQRSFVDPSEPGGIGVDETIARFPDDQSARAHYDALVPATDRFTQPGDVVTNTGTVAGDGYDGTTWRMENTEYGTTFVYGAVVRGDIVAVVTYSVPSGEPRDITADQMRGLIDVAGRRLGAT